MTRFPLTGVLLAGGRSSRLGRPKYLLDFGGRPLGLLLLDELRTICSEVLIVANDAAPFRRWKAPVVPDDFPGCGPLAGLHAGLAAAAPQSQGILAVACDLPFFTSGFGRLLAGLLPAYDAVVPRHGEYLEPLCAAYGPAALEAMERQLRGGRGRVRDIFPHISVRYVDEEERRRFGPDKVLFLNINSQEDLAVARGLWRERAHCPQAGVREGTS